MHISSLQIKIQRKRYVPVLVSQAPVIRELVGACYNRIDAICYRKILDYKYLQSGDRIVFGGQPLMLGPKTGRG